MNVSNRVIAIDVFETLYKHTLADDYIYSGLKEPGIAQKNASLIWAIFSIVSCFIIAYLLYRKKIFIKL